MKPDGLRIRHATFVDFPDGTVRIRSGGELTLLDGRIAGYDPTVTADGSGPALDARGLVVLPGLVNCHGHGYSTFARGMSLASEPPANFLQILDRLWWWLDRSLAPEDLEASLLPVLGEAIRSGTTVIFDHHSSPGAIPGSLAAIGRAFGTAGLRGDLCYETSDRDGPDALEAALAENADFLARGRETGRLAGHFGLHAAFTCSDQTLNRAREMAQAAGAGLHLHVAEDQADQEHSLAHHGRRVVRRLHDLGILGPDTIAAHCVHVKPEEAELLAETGTFVAHNPRSNLGNAVGIADLPALLEAGVRIGLGTDGCSMRMQNGLAFAGGLQRSRSGDPRTFGAGELLNLAFHEPYRLAARSFGLPFGSFEPGAAGDLAAFDYDPPTPLNEGNLEGHLVFGLVDAPVRWTVCAGRLLWDGSRVLSFDTVQAAREARERAEALWRRLGVAP